MRAQAGTFKLPDLRQLADNIRDPVLRAVVKEPVAFWGGAFAGVLGLDIQEDPLRGWLERTRADAGVPYQMMVDRLASEAGRNRWQQRPR
ncbi:hypothetical protein WJX72_004326 [[Myrmecia] bisecta]|uniref:Uncharacterized protein n=1 Tax=[Myrmecia] bisecta TaxID=41462 RepID=A0AAW1Q8P9_9CHLO